MVIKLKPILAARMQKKISASKIVGLLQILNCLKNKNSNVFGFDLFVCLFDWGKSHRVAQSGLEVDR